MISLISLESVLFSLLTSSSCRVVSSYADLILKSSDEAFLVSFWLTSRSKERRSTLPLYSEMVLSNCLAFLSMAALTTWAWSRLVDISVISFWILPLAFSIWASLALRLMAAASPSALALSLRTFSREEASSSRASLATSSSCSRFLYFPRRSCLSLASLSQRDLMSLSRAARADLALASMFKLFSRSPTTRRSSPFSLDLVDGVKVVNQVLVGLVSRSLASDNLISGSSGIRDFSHDGLLVLVNLGLHLLEGINLLLHLKNSISVLPLQVAKDRLRGNVGLLNILAELDNFSLTLLVKLNLGNSGTTGLIVSLAELLNLTSHVRSLTLSLGTSLTLSLKLLFSSLNTGLELLDVLLGLGNKGLLIVKLRREHMDVLLLVGNGVLNISLLSLKISNRVLRHLEVSLNLSLLLLKGGSGLLFLVKSSLKLVKSRLKLRLDSIQVLDLLLSRDKILSRLSLGGRQVLLLLVQLVDDLILLSNLVLESLDGMVTVALLLLNLGDGKFNIFNVLLDSSNASTMGLNLSSKGNSGLFLTLEDLGLGGKPM